jgi:hypothetical protein
LCYDGDGVRIFIILVWGFVKMGKFRNSILVIRPYKYYGTWVFDDENVGLVREAFVAGMPEIIERCLFDAGIDLVKAERGFSLIFSSNYFPGYQVELSRVSGDKLNEDSGGNWYEGVGGLKGWLCPALFCYFDEAPEKIYAKVGC